MNTKQELIDRFESQLDLNDEMKDSLIEIESIKESDMFTSKEALEYLRKLKDKQNEQKKT